MSPETARMQSRDRMGQRDRKTALCSVLHWPRYQLPSFHCRSIGPRPRTRARWIGIDWPESGLRNRTYLPSTSFSKESVKQVPAACVLRSGMQWISAWFNDNRRTPALLHFQASNNEFHTLPSRTRTSNCRLDTFLWSTCYGRVVERDLQP